MSPEQPESGVIDSMDRPLRVSMAVAGERVEFMFWRLDYEKWPAFRFSVDRGALAEAARGALRELRAGE